MNHKVILITFLFSALVFSPGCLKSFQAIEGCAYTTDAGECIWGTFDTFVEDSFERDAVVGDPVHDFNFGWRQIINDNGQIINSGSGNNVEAKIYDGSILGPAGHQTKSLFFRGRAGSSIHNIYLISKTFDLSNHNAGSISFKYLLFDLEPTEHLRVEVCNNSLSGCGIDDTGLDPAGLNSSSWETIFEVGPESNGNGLDGINHSQSDWIHVEIPFFLENYPHGQFTFRFNVRMDEGFFSNVVSNGMEDGVAIDQVRAMSFDESLQ